MVNPSEISIGRIDAGGNALVNFSVTPQQQTDLTLKITYDNGDNPHTMSNTLPVRSRREQEAGRSTSE